MKLLLSSLLFASLCALSSWSVSSGSHVATQSPDVSVMEGETVTISCCWTVKVERGRITWLKNQTRIENFMKNQSQGSLPTETLDCSNLTFTNITREVSGTYTCKVIVEIPVFITLKGNGTVITVMTRDNNTKDNTEKDNHPETHNGSSPPLPMIISLAVVASLFLITLACFCALRRRQARAARVIYEVPHIDSEEAEMDKHSTTSSRGSSQWCQVPVYESFDYFERVQTKESG